MSVDTLRAAVVEKAQEMRVSALLNAGVVLHKRGWRTCPCSWCDLKREATVVIGSPPPLYREPGVLIEDRKHIWRAEKRHQYRQQLKSLEQCP